MSAENEAALPDVVKCWREDGGEYTQVEFATKEYVGNNNSRQITALSVGPGGTLSYGSTTTLNGSSFELLGLAMGRSGAYLFGLEQYDPESLAVVAVNGITMTEVAGSPFLILHDPYDPGSLVAVPGKACR